MYCKKCGKEIPDESNFCPYCGDVIHCKTEVQKTDSSKNEIKPIENPMSKANEKANFGIILVCATMPVMGFVLYYVWKDEKPRAAKSCRKAGFIGTLIIAILALVGGLVYFGFLYGMLDWVDHITG